MVDPSVARPRILGEWSHPPDPLPPTLVAARVELAKLEHRVHVVTGPGGSGKSALARALVDKLAEREPRSLVLMVGAKSKVCQELLGAIRADELATFLSARVDVRSLVKGIDGLSEDVRADVKVYVQRVVVPASPIILVVEDLDADMEVWPDLVSVVDSAGDKVRFVFVGRGLEAGRHTSSIELLQQRLWTRVAAREILRCWAHAESKDQAVASFDAYCERHLELKTDAEVFSTYFLRMTFAHLTDDPQGLLSPSSLVEDAISKHVQATSSAVSMAEVVDMLRSNMPPASILERIQVGEERVSKTISTIAWKSRFKSPTGGLSEDLLSAWLPGHSRADCERLLGSLHRAGLVVTSKSGTYWASNHLMDAFAAVYFARYAMDKEREYTLSRGRLTSALHWILDPPRLVELASEVPPEGVSDLIDAYSVCRLARHPQTSRKLVHALIDRAVGLRGAGGALANVEQQLTLWRVAANVIDLCGDFGELQGDPEDIAGVLAARASLGGEYDCELYFREVSRRGGRASMALSIAARVWSGAQVLSLIRFLCHEQNGCGAVGSERHLEGATRAWRLWCSRLRNYDELVTVVTGLNAIDGKQAVDLATEFVLTSQKLLAALPADVRQLPAFVRLAEAVEAILTSAGQAVVADEVLLAAQRFQELSSSSHALRPEVDGPWLVADAARQRLRLELLSRLELLLGATEEFAAMLTGHRSTIVADPPRLYAWARVQLVVAMRRADRVASGALLGLLGVLRYRDERALPPGARWKVAWKETASGRVRIIACLDSCLAGMSVRRAVHQAYHLEGDFLPSTAELRDLGLTSPPDGELVRDRLNSEVPVKEGGGLLSAKLGLRRGRDRELETHSAFADRAVTYRPRMEFDIDSESCRSRALRPRLAQRP